MKFQTDSIIYDTKKITDYQADSRFDYNSQLDMPDYSWFDIISRWFNRLLNTIFSGKFEENVTTPVMIFLFIAAIAAIIYFLYKKRPELFTRTKKTAPLPYSIEEENIHIIDFNKEIYSALENRDYRLATRLLYLLTLRIFSDNKLIDWQIHKTPTEYLYEIKNIEIKPLFRELTNHFLQVRYGNYIATHELYMAMHDNHAKIKKIIERVYETDMLSVSENSTVTSKAMEGGANER